MPIKCICKICGKVFYRQPSVIKNGYGIYCSSKCQHIDQNKKISCICLNCGNEYKIKLSIFNKGSKFCSKSCKYKYQTGDKNPLFKPRIKKICGNCGIEYIPITSPSKTGKFCSKKCHNEWLNNYMMGNNNPFYGKHHTKEYKKIRTEKYSGVNASCHGRTGNKHPMFGHIGELNPFYGKHHTKESKLKMSISQIGKNSGNKNPSYIHGERLRKYCYQFTGVGGVRERSLAFFNNKCIECGKTNKQNKQECGKSLDVHHVYYRKMSCCENELEYESGVRKIDNKLFIKEHNGEINEHEIIGKPEKFAVLCKQCHSKTTSRNRYFWIQYYEDKINKLYNGKSFLTKEEYNSR
jgi:hypothetical protein